MAHQTYDTELSPEEIEFRDLMQHGDDFLKIELLRPAKSWYQKALALKIHTEQIEQKIAECNRLIAFEVKVIRILAGLALIVILGLILF